MWSGTNSEMATWEYEQALQVKFPDTPTWGASFSARRGECEEQDGDRKHGGAGY
jgi:hypothetical protein